MAEVQSVPPALGDVLLMQGLITRSQLHNIQEAQKITAHSTGRIAVELGLITEKALLSILQLTYGFETLNLAQAKLDPGVSSLIPRPFAEKHNLYPIRKEGKNCLVVAMQDPSDSVVVDTMRHQVGMEIKAYAAQVAEIKHLLDPEGRMTETPLSFKLPPERGRLYRIVKQVAFPVIAFSPLPAFFLLMLYNDDFSRMVLSNLPSEFDLAVYVGLGWGLWAILLYEANGLIFGRDEEEK